MKASFGNSYLWLEYILQGGNPRPQRLEDRLESNKDVSGTLLISRERRWINLHRQGATCPKGAMWYPSTIWSWHRTSTMRADVGLFWSRLRGDTAEALSWVALFSRERGRGSDLRNVSSKDVYCVERWMSVPMCQVPKDVWVSRTRLQKALWAVRSRLGSWECHSSPHIKCSFYNQIPSLDALLHMRKETGLWNLRSHHEFLWWKAFVFWQGREYP